MKKIIGFIRNYWYYYKVYVITGVLVLALLIFSFATAGKEEKYDRYVGVISSKYYTDEQVEALKQAFTGRYGSIGVNVYCVALGKPNQDETVIVVMEYDLGQCVSDILLIEDIDTFCAITEGIVTSEPVRVSDIPYLAGLGFDDLWVVYRS